MYPYTQMAFTTVQLLRCKLCCICYISIECLSCAKGMPLFALACCLCKEQIVMGLRNVRPHVEAAC